MNCPSTRSTRALGAGKAAAGRRGYRIGGALAIFSLVSATGCPGSVPKGSGARPNFVLIVTDDQAFATLQYLPHIEAVLIRAGTTFENFFLTDPLCCPARVTFILGEYRHNHLLESDTGGCAHRFLADRKQRRSIGSQLREAGYRTSMIGKYLNSYQRYLEEFETGGDPGEIMYGWDDYHVLAEQTNYYNFLLHENGHVARHPAEPAVHQSDVLTGLAIEFIESSARSNQPFFVFVAPQAPHAPAVAPERHRGTIVNIGAPRGPSFNQADVSTQPSLRGFKRLMRREIGRVDWRFQQQVEILLSIDEMVRDIVEALERESQLDNTFILFTSDNGYHFGDHRIPMGKESPFEETIRFPLIVRGPGVPAGVSLPHLVSNADVLPSLLDLAGAPPNPRADGSSIAPLLKAGARSLPWRRSLAIESTNRKRTNGVPAFVGIRTARYKLVSYFFEEPELYDLVRDPGETRNVYSETDEAIVDELSERLDELLDCSGYECRQVEDAPFRHLEAGRVP